MSARLRGKNRQRLAVLGLCGASVVLAAVLFEVGVRLLEPQPADPYRYSVHTYYEPVPEAEFVYRRREFRVPVRFNGFGMRDRERSLHKPPGVQRIVLLGDSFAEAMQVPQDSMVSQCLERALQDCLRGQSVEVLNFGVSGYGTAAAAARYATLARRFEPDLVLLLFVHNDPWDLVQQDSRLYTVQQDHLVLQPQRPGWMSRRLRPWIDFGKHHFHAQRFLKYRYVHWRQAPQKEAAAAAAQAGDGELRPGDLAWERMRQALALLQDLALRDEAAFSVAQATTAGPAMSAELARVCADLGVPYFDLVPVLEEAPGPVFFRFDGHWRSQGHAAASQALAPWLCASLRQRAAAPGAAAPGTRGGRSDL